MPPIRGHPKTFVLFDPFNEDIDETAYDDVGMPPLVENPFPFTASPSSDATEYSPNPIAHKFTFEHDLIKGIHNIDDEPPSLVDQPEHPQTFTFAPPYMPPSSKIFSQPRHDFNIAPSDLDLPPLIEFPGDMLHEGKIDYEEQDGLQLLADQPFAADIKTSAFQKRDPSYIPRPPNAFILFRSSFIKGQKESGGQPGSKILAKTVSLAWRSLPPEERSEWEAKALIAQAEHRQRYPDWRFNHAAGEGKRRAKKVKDGPALKGPKRGIGGKARLSNKILKGKEKELKTSESPPELKREPSTGSLMSPLIIKETWGNCQSSNLSVHNTQDSAESSSGERLNEQSTGMSLQACMDVGSSQSIPHNDFGTLSIQTSQNSLNSHSDLWLSNFSDEDSASPPPTSPFIDSDSVMSSPQSPFMVSFSESRIPASNLGRGMYSAPANRPYFPNMNFALPTSALTERPSPAAAVAAMYNMSSAGAGIHFSNTGSVSYAGTPATSNSSLGVEQLVPFNDTKTPNLKRSLSAPAAHNRMRPRAPPKTVIEGNESFQSPASVIIQSAEPVDQIATGTGHSMERMRSSISEGNMRSQMPHIVLSPSKRGRSRAYTHTTSSNVVRGPRRLVNSHPRRESFSEYSLSQTRRETWSPTPTFEDSSFYEIYNHSVNNNSNTVSANHLDIAFSPQPSTIQVMSHSQPSTNLYRNIPASINSVLYRTALPLAVGPEAQDINHETIRHSFLNSLGSTSRTSAFAFGHMPSSSFSSLANWAGGNVQGSSESR